MLFGMHFQASRDLSRQIDAGQYSDTELLTFKIPLAVAYYNAGSEYHNVKGTFEHKGSFFTMVRQKLDRDTLYVVCLNNKPKQQLVSHLSDFINHSSGSPIGAFPIFKIAVGLSKSFIQELITVESGDEGWQREIIFLPSESALLSRDYPVLLMPPALAV